MLEPEDLCRLCAKEAKQGVNLFALTRTQWLQQLKAITGLTLEDAEHLPRNVCSPCALSLEQAFNFRKRCIESQKYFSSLVYSSNLANTSSSNVFEELCTPSPMSPLKEELNVEMDIFESEAEVDEEFLQLNFDESDASSPAAAATTAVSGHNSTDEEDKARPKRVAKRRKALTTAAQSDSSDQGSENKADKQNKRKSKSKTPKAKTNFICDQCGRNYNSYTEFNLHLRKHAGIKPYQCEICSESFYTQAQLTRHMHRHTGDLPIPCRHCPRRFNDYSTRCRHERTHTNIRPYLCTQCGKSFTQSYYLKNHMLTHTGERSFKCHYCDKTFSRQTHLTTHYRALFHKQNVEKYEQEHGKQTQSTEAAENGQFFAAL